MANANHAERNRLRSFGGVVLTPQVNCPIALGDTGLWLDSNAVVKFRNADGSDTVPGAPAAVTTSDATPTAIAAVPVPAGKSVIIEVRVVGTKAGASQGAGYVVRGVARNNSGVLSPVGHFEMDFVAKDDPAWGDPSFSSAGSNVVVQVTGKAATTIQWSAEVVARAA
jgi:hypothetical protein